MMLNKPSRGEKLDKNCGTFFSFEISRLRVELEDWKSKTLKMQDELNQVKAQYKEMERRVEANKETNVALTQQKEQLSAENQELSSRLEALLADNK